VIGVPGSKVNIIEVSNRGSSKEMSRESGPGEGSGRVSELKDPGKIPFVNLPARLNRCLPQVHFGVRPRSFGGFYLHLLDIYDNIYIPYYVGLT
jgi:hypothetical protein